MKICVTSRGTDLTSPIDPRFGRCAYFIIVDTESQDFEAFENTQAQSGGGAGIQSGQFVADKGAGAVLTGHVGPNAHQTLRAFGIEIFTGLAGSVEEAVSKYKSGGLKPTTEATVEPHFGSKQGG
jgi:predicted Fe-Mo cluster-binding NifX family protein